MRGRLTLALGEKSGERLEALLEQTEAQSRTAVIRNALRLYERYVRCRAAGGEFIERDADGSERALILI